ncbi:hypothetical protein LCGC14_1212800 [marine sediment metagenome]|uniref:Uncharacterized protein n=1 Tax=marine sediment metagenome TaxID=412755 RepID=A0A0F9LDG8_9ZZZZ
MADELCPTCHSRIGTNSTQESERAQGKQGTDDNGNPIPRWTDDPTFTPRGFSGDAYSERHNTAKKVYIRELQDTRKAQEEEAGFSEALKTQFSDVDVDFLTSARHITELRESTEKLLNEVGSTLEDYFKLDDGGNEQTQNPKIVQSGGNDPQDEWVDVERGREYIGEDGSIKSTFTLPDNTTDPSPTTPQRVHLRAIHFEDLRHPLIVKTRAMLIEPFNGRLYKAKLTSGVTFKDTEEC